MEIERKFLLKNEMWRHEVSHSTLIQQAVITKTDAYHTRVRIAEYSSGYTECTLTMKSNKVGVERFEEVMVIPLEAAQELLLSTSHLVINKRRFNFRNYGSHYTVDEFEGGGNILEIEYPDEHSLDDFEIPEWAGEEVTDNPKYYFVNAGA